MAAAPGAWVSFVDDDGDTWLFDLTFLTSSWTCTFGRGCPGTESGAGDTGCCSHGAHLFDDEDRQNVADQASRLTDEQWQHRPLVTSESDLFESEDGAARTAVVDGACVFLNRAGFAGGAGCALHIGALASEERPLDWKPAVCWQVPLRLEEQVDAAGRSTYTLRAWRRGDWGEGGDEFDFWCTDVAIPAISGRGVVDEMASEIVELVGQWPYDQLRNHVDSLRSIAVATPARRD